MTIVKYITKKTNSVVSSFANYSLLFLLGDAFLVGISLCSVIFFKNISNYVFASSLSLFVYHLLLIHQKQVSDIHIKTEAMLFKKCLNIIANKGFFIIDETKNIIHSSINNNNLNLESVASKLKIPIKVTHEIDNNIKNNKHFTTTFTIETNLGLETILLKAVPIEISKNNIIDNKRLFLVTVNEILEDKNTIEALSELKVGFYQTDNNGIFTKANSFLAKMLGYHLGDLIDGTKKAQDVLASSTINPQDNNQKDGQKFLTITNKFDEQIPALIVQKSNSKGAFGYCIKLLDNSIIEKNKGMEDICLSYTWELVFKESPYPVLALDQSGKILRINDSAFYLVDSINKPLIELVEKAAQKQIEKAFIELSHDFNHHARLVKNVKLLETDKTIDIYINQLLNLDFNLHGFLVRIEDVTKRNQKESSISHAQRMQTIGYLSGAIAHDFNNILTAIIGFCDLLLLKHKINDPSFHNIMQIKQSANRAASLINRVLAFSRKQTLKPQKLNLNELFGDSHQLIKRLVGNIKLLFDIDTDLWTVKFDPVQLEQVILNIVVNARHAVKEPNGILNIKAFNAFLEKETNLMKGFYAPIGDNRPFKGEYVIIDIIDNGHGISPELYDKIFEPFFTTRQKNTGTGLGLSTAYGIVKQSGGYLLFKSEIDKGSIFRILLPRHQNSLVEQKPEQAKISSKAEGKHNILLIEDEESVRTFINDVLVNNGYNVFVFESGDSATQKLKEMPKLDLIISDVVLPGKSGPEFVENISSKLTEEISVLFISGYGEEVFTQNYGEDRSFNFLAKPFTLKDLLEKIKVILEDR